MCSDVLLFCPDLSSFVAMVHALISCMQRPSLITCLAVSCVKAYLEDVDETHVCHTRKGEQDGCFLVHTGHCDVTMAANKSHIMPGPQTDPISHSKCDLSAPMLFCP